MILLRLQKGEQGRDGVECYSVDVEESVGSVSRESEFEGVNTCFRCG